MTTEQYQIGYEDGYSAGFDDGIKPSPTTQEPSAWITPDGEGFRLRLSVPNQDVPLGWDALYAHPAPQQPAKTNWSELVQWWESGGEQWDVLWNIVTRMVNTAAPQAKPLTDGQIQEIWNVSSGSLPGWRRHIAYARAIEAAHNIGVKP